MKELSIPLYFIQSVLKHAAQQGYDTDRLLRRSRISPRLLALPNARVDAAQFAKLQSDTMREMGDEMLGYLNAPLNLGSWSVVCHWMINKKTLGQAMKRFCLFYTLIERGLHPKMSVTGKEISITFEPWPSEKTTLDCYAYELTLFSFHRFCCWLTQSMLPIERITLDYDKPAHVHEYRKMFLGTPLAFNAQACTLVFKRQLLEQPIQQSMETLTQFLRKPLLNILINNYRGNSWIDRTKSIIGEDLSHLPTLTQVAAQLNMNTKKLRRLLNEEGTSFSELKVELRRDLAIYHLSKQTMSIEDIAHKTGFSEASAFIRAFKMWTGVTPYTYRKGLS